MPTFRRPALLKRAVLSVLNQSAGDCLVQILDNASGDETRDVVHELMHVDPRVRYHEHPQNIGVLPNMAYGMERVTTPYFNILCDDDLLMPEFFADTIRAHDEAESPLAFVSSRVVVADHTGRVAQSWQYPTTRGVLSPPDGVDTCIRFGASLPGVMYRSTAMAAIGPFRTVWWNWTESGWHALAALTQPIGFVPDIGAIIFVHPGNTSNQMNGADFRVSWFEMMAELHDTARRARLSERWWRRRVQPLVYRRFAGTVTRLCSPDGAKRYPSLGRLAIAAGLDGAIVRGTLALAKAAAVVGVGAAMNAAFDRVESRHRLAPRVVGAPDDGSLRIAAQVFDDLNRQAGVLPHGVHA